MPSEFLHSTRAAAADNLQFEFPRDALAGRVVLAPGGAGGLGSATVALLARDGAQVVVGYRVNRERAERLASVWNARGPGRVHIVAADIRDPTGRAQLVEAASRLGPVYGLVNFLGHPARVALEQLDETALADSLSINYTAPLLLARDVALPMQENSVAGSIVFLASMQAVASFEGSVNYAGAKAALVHAALILAKQWGPLIRVNVVAPGVTQAGMARSSIESGKYDRFVRDRIVPRFGYPEDVARVVRLFLEPDNYLTGQVITVDGGLTLRRDRGR